MNRFGQTGSGTTALAGIGAATLLALAAAGLPGSPATADSHAVPDIYAVPRPGQEVPFPTAEDGPGIEEVGRTSVSLLTFGIYRIELRLNRLSDKHPAKFRIAYDAKKRRIRISVESGKMKATDENCRNLIGIVKKDAGVFGRMSERSPTDYAQYFVNAGEFAANIDSRFDIEVIISNSFESGGASHGLTVTDRASCKDGLTGEYGG